MQLYDQQVSVEELKNRLLDNLAAWVAEHGYNDNAVHNAMKATAKQFVESTIRAERPKLQTRMNKDKENYEKRQQASIEAKSKWESMDVKDVLSPALLESAQAKTARNKPIRVQDGGALAFLVKDNAELCRQHNIKFEAGQAPNTPKRRTRVREAVLPRSRKRGHLRSFGLLGRPDLQEQARKLQQRAEAATSRRASRCVSKARGRAKRKARANEGRENSTKEAVFFA